MQRPSNKASLPTFSNFSPFNMTPDFKQLTQEALDAFWECITRRFPEAKTGDLSPLILFRLTEAAESAVKEWVFANVPNRRRRKAAPVTQAEATHTPGPWFVGGIDMDCARFGITARDPTEYIASVGLLDDPRRPKRVRANVWGHTGGDRPAFDHPQGVVPVHRIRRQIAAAADGAEEGSGRFVVQTRRVHVLHQVRLGVVVQWHFVVPPTLLVEPHPVPAVAQPHVFDPHFE